MKAIISTVGLFLVCAMHADAGQWPQFRGPAGDGIAAETGLPTTWDRNQNVRWRAPLPAPGNSSPVVWSNRVFVTVATEKDAQRHLLCFDRKTGKELWRRTVHFSGHEPTHGTNPACSSTPAADAERVVVWHSSAGLFCYSHAGKELWKRDLGKFIHIWGYAASPILYKDAVIVHCGPGERTFLIALHKRTGKTLWQVDEPGGASGLVKRNPDDQRAPWIGSWSTPVVARVAGQDQILVSYPQHVRAHDPATGKVLWTCGGLGDLVYTSVVAGSGYGVAMGGFHGPALGFALPDSPAPGSIEPLWRHTSRNPQRIGSGIILGEHLFMVNEPGIVQCFEVASGKELWQERLPGGNVWGSPSAVDGRIYVTNQRGDTILFAPNPQKLELLGVNKLGERSNSTPAFSDGEIFLRTFNALYCIAEKR